MPDPTPPAAVTPPTPDVVTIAREADDLGLAAIESSAPAAETTPAETTPATPAETPEQVTEPEAAAAPTETPAPTEPPTPPAVQPPAAEPAKPPAAPSEPADTARQAAVQQFQSDYAAITKKIADGTYDPIDDGATATKTMIHGLELLNAELTSVRQQSASLHQQTAAEKYWLDFQRTNPAIGAEKARSIFNAELSAQAKKGLKGDALQAAATVGWEYRIEALKAATGPIKDHAQRQVLPPPVNRGAARVTPPTQPNTPPKPKPQTVDEKLEAGVYGDLRNLV